jgi:hypothetical protein
MNNNIIEFPIDRIKKGVFKPVPNEQMTQMEYGLESVETAIHLFFLLEEELEKIALSEGKSPMNFREVENYEARDMYAIVNMMSAMLIRKAGVDHMLHDYMDKIYELIMSSVSGRE